MTSPAVAAPPRFLQRHRTPLVAGAVVAAALAAVPLGIGEVLGVTPAGAVALAVLVVAATLWITEAVPLFVTSFVVLALCLVWLVPVLGAGGQEVSGQVFLSPFFSDVILLFLGGFVLSAGLTRYQLDERLALGILRRIGGSVPRIVAAIVAVTGFLSMWLSNTATAAMMLALCLPIARALPEGDRYRQAILLSIPFAANLGGIGTPIGSPPNAIAIQYMRQGGFDPGFGMWLAVGVPGVLLMLTVLWGVLMLFFRGETKRIDLDALLAESSASSTKLSPGAWWVLSVSLLTAVGWVTEGWHGVSAGTVALLPLLALFGPGLLTVRELRAMPWDVLLVMGGGLCLGRAIELSGLAVWLVDALPVGPSSGTLVLVVVFAGVACAMSCVMSNTAAANVVVPIALGIGTTELAPILVGVAFGCSLAMALPISTPPNAMAFGSGELTGRQMLGPGLAMTLIGLALAVTTGYWWWDLIGLF